MAQEWGKLSHCERKKVGALIVKNGMIISDGFNGTPTGFDNPVKMKRAILNGMFYTQRQMQF